MDNYFDLNPFIDFNEPALEIATFIILGIVLFIILVFLIFDIIGRWMLFVKANQEGWKALIPIYKNWVYTVEVCKCHWGVFLCEELILFTLIPTFFIFRGATSIALLLIKMIKNYNLAIKTQQSPTVYIWLALFSVPMDVILGYCRKSYEYIPDAPSSGFGFFGEKN